LINIENTIYPAIMVKFHCRGILGFALGMRKVAQQDPQGPSDSEPGARRPQRGNAQEILDWLKFGTILSHFNSLNTKL
jgi:hypothetical protein